MIASGWHTAASDDARFYTGESISPSGQSRLARRRRVALEQTGFPGDELSVRATVLEARRSESRPDRGIVRTFIEVLNQKREVVMSLKMVNFVRCREPKA